MLLCYCLLLLYYCCCLTSHWNYAYYYGRCYCCYATIIAAILLLLLLLNFFCTLNLLTGRRALYMFMLLKFFFTLNLLIGWRALYISLQSVRFFIRKNTATYFAKVMCHRMMHKREGMAEEWFVLSYYTTAANAVGLVCKETKTLGCWLQNIRDLVARLYFSCRCFSWED